MKCASNNIAPAAKISALQYGSAFSSRAVALWLLLFCNFISAQRGLFLDSLTVKRASDLLADDYGNIYLYTPKDFSFTKYDSLGLEQARLMFTLPFSIRSVQNPLAVFAFSENAQEIQFFDNHFAVTQKADLHEKFGHILHADTESREEVWLLEESGRRLLQYSLRDKNVLVSVPFMTDTAEVRDFIVFKDKVFVLTAQQFLIFRLNGERLFSIAISGGKKLRRENGEIFVLTADTIHRYSDQQLEKVFEARGARIVDKNSTAFFAVQGNKVYLYRH